MELWKEGINHLKRINVFAARREYVGLIFLGNIGQMCCRTTPKLYDTFFWGWLALLAPLLVVALLYLGIRYHRLNRDVFSHESARYVLKLCALVLCVPALWLVWLRG